MLQRHLLASSRFSRCVSSDSVSCRLIDRRPQRLLAREGQQLARPGPRPGWRSGGSASGRRARGRSTSWRISSRSQWPLIAVSRLLKSCATPPASWPIACIFWLWTNCASSVFSSVASEQHGEHRGRAVEDGAGEGDLQEDVRAVDDAARHLGPAERAAAASCRRAARRSAGPGPRSGRRCSTPGSRPGAEQLARGLVGVGQPRRSAPAARAPPADPRGNGRARGPRPRPRRAASAARRAGRPRPAARCARAAWPMPRARGRRRGAAAGRRAARRRLGQRRRRAPARRVARRGSGPRASMPQPRHPRVGEARAAAARAGLALDPPEQAARARGGCTTMRWPPPAPVLDRDAVGAGLAGQPVEVARGVLGPAVERIDAPDARGGIAREGAAVEVGDEHRVRAGRRNASMPLRRARGPRRAKPYAPREEVARRRRRPRRRRRRRRDRARSRRRRGRTRPAAPRPGEGRAARGVAAGRRVSVVSCTVCLLAVRGST